MGVSINRGLSLFVYFAYLAAAYLHGTGVHTLAFAAFFLLPLGCIWFPEAFGGYTGLASYQLIDTATPGILMTACGWLLLVGLPVLLFLITGGIT